MSHLEATRRLHEDVERHVDELIQEIALQPQNHRHRVHHEHFLSTRIELIRGKKRKIAEAYDAPAAKQRVTESVSAAEKGFFARLQEIRDYHKKFPDVPVESRRLERPHPDTLPVSFSGEECYGRYLDLHELYQEYMRLPFNYEVSKEAASQRGNSALRALRVKPIDYPNWMRRCTMFQFLEPKWKTGPYREYLEAFLEYLRGFCSRTQPLSVTSEQVLEEAKQNFKKRWLAGDVLGWQHLGGKPAPQRGDKKLTKGERRLAFAYHVAELEDLVQRFYEMFSSQLQATLQMLERKETMQREELDKEERRADDEARAAMLAALEGAPDAAEEKGAEVADPVPFNPLKLPIGWDGKPIPFWLYKLHGLGMKFSCEICRGYVYIGPKAFDKHFQEMRHANGMRCLRIPNTRHFHHVTSVADAQALWAKLKNDAAFKQWRPDNEQEFEDNEGHVFNKSTFDDMRRQGLI